jgi:hypothetical protein
VFSFQGCVSRTRSASEGEAGQSILPDAPSLARRVRGRPAEAGTPAGTKTPACRRHLSHGLARSGGLLCDGYNVPMIDEFRQYISDIELEKMGPLVQRFPKSTFNSSAISQLGIGVVGAGMAAGFLAASFTVVVSQVREEQLPFQQAMWGLAAAFGILSLYGWLTGAWRLWMGLAHVGRWWLIGERGLVILNHGKVEHSVPLTELRVKSATSNAGLPQLVAGGKSLPLPQKEEETVTRAIAEQQRKVRSGGTHATSVTPYALAWSEAKLFGQDRIFRIYPDGERVLVIYAGDFLAEKMGIKSPGMALLGPVGLVAGAGQAYTSWLAGRGFDKRAAFLDAMSVEELREEARNNAASTILTPADTANVHIGPVIDRFWGNTYLQEHVVGLLTFEQPKKKWELAFFSREERNFAIEALLGAFGRERVTTRLDTWK